LLVLFGLDTNTAGENTNMGLTNTTCRNARPARRPVKISDGGGLFLLVQPSGSKLWRLAYRYHGKQKSLAFGSYPAVSLKDARRKRELAKEQLAQGCDPGEVKRAQKYASMRALANSFEAIGREWFEIRRPGWTAGYADRLLRRLEADIFPRIGARPVSDIEPPDLLETVRQIEKRGAIELAKRLLQVSGQIFRFAIASGRATRDPSQDLRGALRSPGPKKHRAALRALELPEFLRALESYSGERSTALGIKLITHTFLRTGEVRFGKWSEIERLEGETPLWRIPAVRMKARAEHLIPLTPQVVAILNQLRRLAGRSEYILPAPTKQGVISQNTLLYAVYRMGYHSRVTIHGLRGTASTILNENGFNRDWIERQLAHVERNDVRAAYNSAEWLEDRRRMMLWWSNYLDDALNGGKVKPFRLRAG
jgi:integrase